MSERIDHAAEARRLAEMASRAYSTIEHRNGEVAVAQELENQTLAVTAQAHATLALVEQQRIANLIAYVQLLETQYAEAARHQAEFDWSTRADSVARHGIALDRIREGLGL